MSSQNRAKGRVQQQPTFVSIPSLARRWDVSRDTIKRAIRAGSLLSVRVGKRYKIHVESAGKQ